MKENVEGLLLNIILLGNFTVEVGGAAAVVFCFFPVIEGLVFLA